MTGRSLPPERLDPGARHNDPGTIFHDLAQLLRCDS